MLQVTTQIQYPNLPQTPFPSPLTLPSFFNYIYNLLIVAGIIIALTLLTSAGLTYLFSGTNVQRKLQAKEQIISALLGLGILLGSYLILSALDPNLTVPAISNLPQIEIPTSPPISYQPYRPSAVLEVIDSYERETLELISFLEASTFNLYNLILSLEILDFTKKVDEALKLPNCANTEAICVPKGLLPIPAKCEWKESPVKLASELLQKDLVLKVRDPILELINSQKPKELTLTLSKINNCLSSLEKQLFIEGEFQDYLSYFNLSSKGPLTFYCAKR